MSRSLEAGRHQGVNEPLFRTTISNIGTSAYETANYLSRIIKLNLSKSFKNSFPISKLNYNIDLISFDVKNLFTIVPL